MVTEYDSLGRKTRVTEDSGGIGRVTDFAYDRAGRLGDLIAYTDGTTGPQTTGYAYSGRGLQTIVTYEDTGDVTMAYDAAGNMTKRTDEASVVVDYAYDTANRLTERKESGSTTDIETYVYDGLGRLITAEKGTSSNGDAVAGSAFTYDSLSRVNEECQSIAEGSGRSVSYAYNKAGNRTEVIYHTAATTANYAYDSRDRGTQIDNGSQRLADYTWLGSAINQRDTTCDYPGSTKPKFKTAFERDGILRVTKVDNQHLTSDQDTGQPIPPAVDGESVPCHRPTNRPRQSACLIRQIPAGRTTI